MTVPEATEWFALIAAGGGALAVVWAFCRRLWKRGRAAFVYVKARLDLLDRELTTNGGSSLKDQVARIDTVQQSQANHFRRLEANDRAHERRIGKVEHELERMRGGGE